MWFCVAPRNRFRTDMCLKNMTMCSKHANNYRLNNRHDWSGDRPIRPFNKHKNLHLDNEHDFHAHELGKPRDYNLDFGLANHLPSNHVFPSMSEKNRQVVADEPVEVQDFKKFTACFRGICGICLKWIQQNRKMSTCNRLEIFGHNNRLRSQCLQVQPVTCSHPPVFLH